MPFELVFEDLFLFFVYFIFFQYLTDSFQNLCSLFFYTSFFIHHELTFEINDIVYDVLEFLLFYKLSSNSLKLNCLYFLFHYLSNHYNNFFYWWLQDFDFFIRFLFLLNYLETIEFDFYFFIAILKNSCNTV